jgi:hypothetical protein
MRFIRFALARRHQDSGVEEGVFTLAYELRDSPRVEAADRELLTENLTWFEKNLKRRRVSTERDRRDSTGERHGELLGSHSNRS